MKFRRHFAITIGCSLCLALSSLRATDLVQEEPILIESIVADPQVYNLRAVRLRGIIHTLERIPGAGGCGGADAYVVIIKDRTGEIPVVDRGACQHNFSRPAKPMISGFSVGDKVEAVIEVVLVPSPNFEAQKLEARLRWVKRLSD